MASTKWGGSLITEKRKEQCAKTDVLSLLLSTGKGWGENPKKRKGKGQTRAVSAPEPTGGFRQVNQGGGTWKNKAIHEKNREFNTKIGLGGGGFC